MNKSVKGYSVSKKIQSPPSGTEVKIIPFLVQWLFKGGLPPGWGKNLHNKD